MKVHWLFRVGSKVGGKELTAILNFKSKKNWHYIQNWHLIMEKFWEVKEEKDGSFRVDFAVP